MNNPEIVNSLRFAKWHFYCEFILFLITALFFFGIFSNPIVKLLFPKWVIILNFMLILAGTVWVGFLSYKMRKLMGVLVHG